MEGRHFALLVSVSIWFISYLISLYFFSYYFSSRIIPSKLRNITNKIKLNRIILTAILSSPIIAGLSFGIGSKMERSNGIAWGCYIEAFWNISFLIWFLLLFVFFIFLIIFMMKPIFFGFKNKTSILKFFLYHNFLTLIHVGIITVLIPLFSGPLSGINSTCL